MMRAAVLRELHTTPRVEHVPEPTAAHGEVIVRVRAAALCASDLHIADGRIPTVELPLITGHELAGEIADVGPGVSGVSVGQPVTASLDVICGQCHYCQIGQTNLCLQLRRIGYELPGAHAEYVKLPARNVLPLPDGIPMTVAAAIPDAVSTVYRGLTTRGGVRVGETVLILGCGGLGIQAVQLARVMGATVFCSDLRDDKLDKARELGADLTINAARDDVVETVLKATDGLGVDVVLDVVGTEQSMKDSLKMCARGGRVMVVGFAEAAFSASFYEVLMEEKSLIGTRAATKPDIADVIELVASGRITPVVGHVFPLEDIAEAIHMLRRGEIMGRAVFEI